MRLGRISSWFLRGKKPVAALPQSSAPSPDWTAEDRDALKRVFASPTGLRLIARLNATHGKLAIANSRDTLHTEHSAGNTTGYGDCISHLISLSVAAPQVANDVDASGEVPANETTEQTISRMNRELVARYSP